MHACKIRFARRPSLSFSRSLLRLLGCHPNQQIRRVRAYAPRLALLVLLVEFFHPFIH
jgi:hypothetical protein